MAWDLTGLQTAAATVGGIIAAGVAWLLLTWRNFSKTRYATAKEEGELTYIRNMREDLRRTDQELADARAEIRSMHVVIGDLRQENGGLRAQVGGLQERLRESLERLAEIAAGRERIAGQCEERVRAMNEQMLQQRMILDDQKRANAGLLVALAAADEHAARRIVADYMPPQIPQEEDTHERHPRPDAG